MIIFRTNSYKFFSGGHLVIGRVVFGVPPLSSLVTYNIWVMMGHSSQRVDSLPLPSRERNVIRELDHHVIRVCFLELIASIFRNFF